MSEALDIWRGGLEIPPLLLEDAKSISKVFDRSVCGMIETDHYERIELVFTPGVCPWHDDRNLGNWSGLLVLRNDTESWVEIRGERPKKVQPVGTLILLDIQKEHRLTRTRGMNNKFDPDKLWVAAAINFKVPGDLPSLMVQPDVVEVDSKPSRDEVEAHFRRLFR